MQYRIAKLANGKYVVQKLLSDAWTDWPACRECDSFEEAEKEFKTYQQREEQRKIDEVVIETFDL